LALLEKLGAEQVYVTGTSYGGQCAIKLAEELKKRGMLGACAPVACMLWETKTTSYSTPEKVALARKFSKPWLIKPMMYYGWSGYAGMMGDFEKFCAQMPDPEFNREMMKDFCDIKLFNEGMFRSCSYFRHHVYQYTLTGITSQDVDSYVDWKVFNDPSITFAMWYAADGKDDQVSLSAQEKVINDIGENAQLKLYRGTHLTFPLVEVARSMVEGQCT